MKIKDILAKVAKGEALNDEEKKFLAEYDADKTANDAAAAARRKAEEDRDKLKAELEQKLVDLQKQLDETKGAKMTDLQKAQAQVDQLSKQVAELTKNMEATQSEKAKLVRQTKIDELARASGIQFVETVDARIMNRAFASAFDDLSAEDLADESKVKPILATFQAVNKGVILDKTGHGAGMPPERKPGSAEVNVNPWKKDTFNLTEQAKIMKADPQRAAALQSEAGVKSAA